MKIMIFSDIHGSRYYTEKILMRYIAEQPDQLLVLGDIMYHGPRNPLPRDYDPMAVAQLLNQYSARIIGVRGNCDAEIDRQLLDYDANADYQQKEFNGRRFFITHGHIYSPEKHPDLPEGSIFVSGHTHLPGIIKRDGIYYLNPGSVSLPKGGNPSSYAIVDEQMITLKDLEGNSLDEMMF